MYKLIKNDFISDGKCRYKDEVGNRVFMTRTEYGFRAKLKFADKAITADVLEIPVPSTNSQGMDLRLNYPQGFDLNREDITIGIKGLSPLIQHWIDMLYAIRDLGLSDNFLKMKNPGASDDDIRMHRINVMSEYEEIKDVLKLL